MEQVVGIRFKKAGKIYYFAPSGIELHLDDGVIVETARGMEYGYVALLPREVERSQEDGELKPIIRRATAKDLLQVERNKEREEYAFSVCLKKIEKFRCPMKLLRVEYTFDKSKIVFFFTADGRVDFRELVKDLASVFHTRIELRQVGVRDEAKQVSGIGPCGRPLCCAAFLGDFAPVSIKMAKNQGLSLNPTKISGACGRLMCCLRYENDLYTTGEIKCPKLAAMDKRNAETVQPRVGMKVVTENGNGCVVYVNSQKKLVKVQLEGQKSKTISWDEIAPME